MFRKIRLVSQTISSSFQVQYYFLILKANKQTNKPTKNPQTQMQTPQTTPSLPTQTNNQMTHPTPPQTYNPTPTKNPNQTKKSKYWDTDSLHKKVYLSIAGGIESTDCIVPLAAFCSGKKTFEPIICWLKGQQGRYRRKKQGFTLTFLKETHLNPAFE